MESNIQPGERTSVIDIESS